jgi:hypothetical protein
MTLCWAQGEEGQKMTAKMATSPHARLAQELARRFQAFATVEAVVMGGSLARGAGDAQSDIDLYVYAPDVIPLSARQALVAEMGASRADLNMQFWDSGDEWFDAATGIEIDVIYWQPAWLENQLDRVWRLHQGSMGYSTCFWYTIRHAQMLFDRRGWFADLQHQSEQPYPEALRRDIVAKNHAVLRRVIPSYERQIAKAASRGDHVSVNHRVAALLASYFDVLFALNRVLHPGEKRLLEYARAQCASLPVAMDEQVAAVLHAAGSADSSVVERVRVLLDGLDDLLRGAGFDPATSLPIA